MNITLLSLWRDAWHVALFIIFLICLVVWLIKFRIKSIQSQKLQLEQQVRERTAELLEKSELVRHQAENLQIANAELQVLNEELTIQRNEAEEARRLAENASQAKTTFLATMSHEIRSPMNGVLGMTSVLSETELSHDQRMYLDIIKVSGENLLNVINDILDFSKIESGRMELDMHNFSLRSVVEEVIDLFLGKAAHGKIELLYQIDSAIPSHLYGDSVRLRQILINLIGNALKFTREGEVYLEVQLIKDNDQGCELAFEVFDTGIGIPEDKKNRLFKSFSQIDASTTRRFGGTGLGLVICERLVEMMGGQISVESELGKGSAFSFNIKLGKSQAVTKPAGPKDIAGRNVLLAVENERHLEILRTQLMEWGLQVSGGSTKEVVLNILAQENTDLVITDTKIQGISGLNLASLIKEKKPELPVILLNPLIVEIQDRYSEVLSSVLIKPVKQLHLSRAIENALNNAGMDVWDSRKTVLFSADFAGNYPLNILVVDDNDTNRKLLLIALEKLGYQAQIAENGLEAIEKLRTGNFNVVLMDVQMPEMDGLTATQVIRKEFRVQPYIIAVTANAMGIDREACFRAGMDEYVSKPIDWTAMLAALQKAFEVLSAGANSNA